MCYSWITCSRLWIHVNMIECEWIDDVWVFDMVNTIMWIDVRLFGVLWIWNFIRFLEVLNDDNDDDDDDDVELLYAKWWYWWWMHACNMKVKNDDELLLNMCIVSHMFMYHKFRIFISNEDV